MSIDQILGQVAFASVPVTMIHRSTGFLATDVAPHIRMELRLQAG
ncbi:hypothetical protein [Streptomyces sp. bgisy027]